MERNVRFKMARLEAGLTQWELAQQCGLPEHEITRIETGRTTPDQKLKELLAEVLKKSTFEIF